MSENNTLPGQEHFVSKYHKTDDNNLEHLSLNHTISTRRNVWNQLKKHPMFWFAMAIIVLVLLLACFPRFFTAVDPMHCILSKSLSSPTYGHWFGFDRQGCDIFARVVYGARASILVGVLSTICASLIGVMLGSLAGFYGGIVDAILSRIFDIFFAVPVVLSAIVLMQIFKDHRSILLVVLVLSVFGWTSIARIMRGSVMVVKNYEFNISALSAGKSRFKVLLTHIIPNAITPVTVYAMVALGSFIVAESTLSFIGLGLPDSIISWGAEIAKAQVILRVKPMVLFYPSIALAITVSSFIILGDLIHHVFNPRK